MKCRRKCDLHCLTLIPLSSPDFSGCSQGPLGWEVSTENSGPMGSWAHDSTGGSFLSQPGFNVILEWALGSWSQNRIKIWNQAFAHKGAQTGSEFLNASWIAATDTDAVFVLWGHCCSLLWLVRGCVPPTASEPCPREGRRKIQFWSSGERRITITKACKLLTFKMLSRKMMSAFVPDGTKSAQG